jgi:hypothetical protein
MCMMDAKEPKETQHIHWRENECQRTWLQAMSTCDECATQMEQSSLLSRATVKGILRDPIMETSLRMSRYYLETEL